MPRAFRRTGARGLYPPPSSGLLAIWDNAGTVHNALADHTMDEPYQIRPPRVMAALDCSALAGPRLSGVPGGVRQQQRIDVELGESAPPFRVVLRVEQQ